MGCMSQAAAGGKCDDDYVPKVEKRAEDQGGAKATISSSLVAVRSNKYMA